MDRLELLAAEVRSKLGDAPVAHDAQWRRLQRDERLVKEESPARRRWIAGFALVAAALLSWALLLRPSSSSKALAAGSAPLEHELGDRSVLVLDRGSRGHLQEGDDSTFFRLESGKANLEVAPQEGRRFEVLAGNYVVTVAGTRFAVWVGTSGNVVVEVAAGALVVTPPRGEPPVRLGAGERLEGDRDGRVSVARPGAVESVPSPSRVDLEPELARGTAVAQAPAKPEQPARQAPVVTAEPDWRARFRARRYPEALASARSVGVERLLVELDAAALADLADVARLGGDSSLNVRVLRALRARFPGTSQASRGAFLLGRALALAGNQREAAAAFEAHLAEDPNGAHSVEALGRLMELYSELGDRARARTRAERYLERAPTGPYQRLARSLVRP